MKTSVYCGDAGVEIEYIFRASKSSSDILIVSFPGSAGFAAGLRDGVTEWGYIVTLSKFDENILFIRSNSEYSKSYMTFCNHEPIIENAIYSLIQKCLAASGAHRVICTGSSMGGFCALYYGLKYDWDIISGSPPYTFFLKESIPYMAGSSNKEDIEWANGLLPSIINEAGNRGYRKKLFLCYGEGEPFWVSENVGKKLVSDLDRANIQYDLKLYPFSTHGSLYTLFSVILNSMLGRYLGRETADHIEEESQAIQVAQGFDEGCNQILTILKESKLQENSSLHIKNCIHYGNRNPWTALRNFLYVKNGWLWVKNSKVPVRMESDESFWSVATKIDYNWSVSFLFQDALLNYYETAQDAEMIAWISSNVQQYLTYLREPRPAGKNWNVICRIHFFIALYCVRSSDELNQLIPEIIEQDLLRLLSSQDQLPVLWRYRLFILFLHISLFYANDEICNITISLLKERMEFDFDKNGVCIFGQARQQDILCREIDKIIKFIDSNKFSESKELRRIRKLYKKICNVMMHMIRPDGLISSLGDGFPEKARCVSLQYKKREDLILPTSNIAILESEAPLSYITVNGGSNIHSSCRHSDLLSFTWFYDGKQIFCDAGHGTGEYEEYAVSSIAHNAFICEGKEYISPDYFDWTTIDSAEEGENYVRLDMSHRLIDGVELKRNFLWFKPNIIILLDEGISKEKQKYSQNFILGNFIVDKRNKNNVIVHVRPGFDVTITQYSIGNDFILQEYRGTSDATDREQFRGSLILKQKTLHPACNLSYTKEGNREKFVTVIECHSNSGEASSREQHVKGIRNGENGQLLIDFA